MILKINGVDMTHITSLVTIIILKLLQVLLILKDFKMCFGVAALGAVDLVFLVNKIIF